MKPIIVSKPFLPNIDEYVDKLKTIWESHWLTHCGQLHNEFEKQVKEYLSVKNITLTVNGHAAL